MVIELALVFLLDWNQLKFFHATKAASLTRRNWWCGFLRAQKI